MASEFSFTNCDDWKVRKICDDYGCRSVDELASSLASWRARATEAERALNEITAGRWTSSGDVLGATWRELRAISIAHNALAASARPPEPQTP